MPRRLCFALDLKPDPASIAEYERFHAPGGVWPEVLADIRAQGIEKMSIWRTGNRMMMIADVSDDFPRGTLGGTADPRLDEWETLMWTFQQALPHAAPGEKWLPMKCIFDLVAHIEHSNQ